MKKKLLLMPICLMAITACSGTAPVDDYKKEAETLIERMRTLTYRVAFNGTQTQTYPKGYEAYNNSGAVSVTRDYGHVDNDLTKLRAARVITDTTTSTYYEAEDGRMYAQVIKEDNTVERSYLSNLGTYYRFGKFYSSPFDFISADDFDETMVLSSQKAYLLFNYYTGLSQPVNKAIFRFNDDGLVKEVKFNFGTLPVGIETADGTETMLIDMEGTISFDYEIDPITYLEPYTVKSNKFETLVNNIGTNYTMNIDSNAIANKLTTYVLDNKVYIHLDSSENTMIANDMFYVKKGSGYRSYIYTGKEWTLDESVQLSDILPDISSLSPYLFEDKSDTHLSLKSEAAAYGANNFLLPYMGLTEGTGLKSEIYTKGDRIDSVTSTFYYYTGNIVVKNTYSNYGTTELPIWLEEPGA